MITARGHRVCRASRVRPSSASGLWTVVLAAGAGRRYGGPKLLLRVQGRPLVTRAATVAVSLTGRQSVVVLGSGAGRLAAELRDLPVGLTFNRHWREGLSTSLAAGIRSLPATARAALVLPADQCLIKHEHLARLVAAWRRRPGTPAAARFGGTIGAPAILPRSWFPRLRHLRGDVGARAMLRGRLPGLTLVDMPEAALDIDLPAERGLLRRPTAVSPS